MFRFGVSSTNVWWEPTDTREIHLFKCNQRCVQFCLITRLAIRPSEEEVIVLTGRAERLVNRWEAGGTPGYPWAPQPPQMSMQTLIPSRFFFVFFLHLEEWHAHINGWIKEPGHHLLDPGANGAAQLRFDFQWTDRDSALMLVCAVYV